ncbi:hypothetical protein GGQ73_004434 [Rhizobium skierniewicense]|uniref:Uncharacterized protein n=1 Tax=Rhizobium skierniewicense TaxID=984260 RepID=A0A7W6CA26_9HYPH|nr:hypothetical protein [Rhizobium skierniewicense]MBB3948447.1 hypothetical protein [Rhizobium skierniewicense]
MAIEFEDLPYSRLEEHIYFLKMLGVGERLLKDVAHVLEELGKDHRYPVPPHLILLLPAEMIPRRLLKIAEVDVAEFRMVAHSLLQIRAAHGDKPSKAAGFAVASSLRGRGTPERRRRLSTRSTLTDREIKKVVRNLRSLDDSNEETP